MGAIKISSTMGKRIEVISRLNLKPIFLILLIPFGVVHAQQFSNYGNMGSDLPQTTNQDVLSRILDTLNSFFVKIINIGNNQDSDLKQIIKNQQIEIDLLQKLVKK